MKKNFFVFLALFAACVRVNAVHAENIVVNTHSSLEHSKFEVIEKYNSDFNTFDYGTSIYDSEPSLTSPYYEGVLKDNVKNAILNQINYFRWLSGLNEVSLNTDKMQRSQKGALITAVNGVLSHTPTQPSDMDDDFYKEAYAGANASWDYYYTDTYSGNLTSVSPVSDFISALVDDGGVASVGHRYSILDPFAFKTSFGFVDDGSYIGRYGAVSMYYDNTNENSDHFYPYPFAGYFPIETVSVSSYYTQYWSIYLVDYSITSNTKITITYNGTDYVIDSDDYTYSSKKVIYELPSELRSSIIKNSKYIDGTSLDFVVSNLSDGTNTIDLEYTTNFISAKLVSLTDIDLCVSDDSSSSCSNIDNDYQFDLNKEYSGEVVLSPSNATVDEVTVDVVDDSVLSYDVETGAFTLKKVGNTDIIITENYTGFSKTISVSVVVPATGIQVNKERISLVKGATFQLEASLLPSDTTDTVTYRWSSNNSSIASVDDTGLVTGHGLGDTIITVTSSNGFSKEIETYVIDYLLGDMNLNNSIELADVITALRMSLGFDEITDLDMAIGDMNQDGVLNLSDVILILRKSVGFDDQRILFQSLFQHFWGYYHYGKEIDESEKN